MTEMHAQDTGIWFRTPEKSKEFKRDVYGHEWIEICVYTLSRAEVLEAIRGETVNLDAESLAELTPIACRVCELTFDFAAHQNCPGEPKGYQNDGRPIHHQRWVRDGFKKMDEEKKNRGRG